MGIDLSHFYLFNPQQRLFPVYLVIAFVMAWIYRRRSGKDYPLLPKSVYLHPSALFDYRVLILTWLVRGLLLVPILPSSLKILELTLELIRSYFEYRSPLIWSQFTINSLYAVTWVFLHDLSRYCCHWLMHHSKILWAYHQFHHEAEVLTPVSFYRTHPVESVLYGLRYSLVAGTVTACFVYFFGARVEAPTILGIHISVIFAHALGANLRHSHIPLAFPRKMEGVFISPRQHQIHHQIDGMRFNLGSTFSIWDRLFGTFKSSYEHKPYLLGCSNKQFPKRYSVIWSLLKPFSQKISRG